MKLSFNTAMHICFIILALGIVALAVLSAFSDVVTALKSCGGLFITVLIIYLIFRD